MRCAGSRQWADSHTYTIYNTPKVWLWASPSQVGTPEVPSSCLPEEKQFMNQRAVTENVADVGTLVTRG